MKYIIIYVLLGISCISCSPSELTRDEYIRYVEAEKNGLKVREEVGEFIFTLQYKPAEYMAIMELGERSTNKDSLSKIVGELSDMEQYNLTIESKDGKKEMLKNQLRNDEEYFRRIEYFSMEAEKDFKLISGNDTIPCGLYHFERSYDITPYSKIVLGFAKVSKDNDADRIVSFDESVLGLGKINFRIKNRDIKKIPSLVL